MGQPRSSGVPAVSSRAGHWQPALGVLVAFAGGIATEVVPGAMVPIGGTVGQLLFYGSIVLVASLSGGALFRSWCVTRRYIVLTGCQQRCSMDHRQSGSHVGNGAQHLSSCRLSPE